MKHCGRIWQTSASKKCPNNHVELALAHLHRNDKRCWYGGLSQRLTSQQSSVAFCKRLHEAPEFFEHSSEIFCANLDVINSYSLQLVFLEEEISNSSFSWTHLLKIKNRKFSFSSVLWAGNCGTPTITFG